MMTIPEIVQAIESLKKKLEDMHRRPSQEQIPPDTVKMRHIAEGVRYIRDGGTSDIPTEGEEPMQGAAIIFDYETNKLWIWNRSEGAWKYAQLS